MPAICAQLQAEQGGSGPGAIVLHSGRKAAVPPPTLANFADFANAAPTSQSRPSTPLALGSSHQHILDALRIATEHAQFDDQDHDPLVSPLVKFSTADQGKNIFL